MSANKLKATSGGTYAEGSVDSINTLNPLFASTQAEQASNKLIFAGLLKYDNYGVLQSDLAQSWQVSKSGAQYTFELKPNLKWHDGQKLDSGDVVATVRALQDPRVGALAQASWKDVKVRALGSRQVVFTLPGAYAPFTAAATFSVLPRHIIEKIAPENLRESDFSKHPVGSGPFRFINLKSVDITSGKSALQLEAFDSYWDGRPMLDQFLLYTYSQSADLFKGLSSHEINAANLTRIDDNTISRQTELKNYHIPLNNGVYAIFKTDSEVLKDVKLRRALVQSIDLAKIRRQLEVKPLDGPVVNNQSPLATIVKQASFDKPAALKLLAESGWVKNKKSGYLEKTGKSLELRLVTVDTGYYRSLVNMLSEQWSSLGIKLDVQVVDSETVQQSVLRPRAYDVLVYELELGGDSDSYAYWHSSQVTGAGLNFANYSSPVADDALTTARVNSNSQLRDAKYATFARQWVSDTPALAIYQPSLSYATSQNVRSLTDNERLPTQSDRFNSVNRWMVETKLTPNSP